LQELVPEGEAEMAKNWLAVALIAGCLTTANLAHAQQCAGGDMVPGPMKSDMAPPGPTCDLSLPGNHANAFSEGCCDEASCCNIAWFSFEWISDPKIPAGVAALPPGSISYDPLNGVRLTAGLWYSSDQVLGGEVSGFTLENAVDSFSGAGRSVSSSSRVWGADADLIYNLKMDRIGIPIEFLAGLAYMHEEDTFHLTTAAGAVSTDDRFSTRNSLYGGEIGLRTVIDCGDFWFGLQSKLAMGDNHAALTRLGATTTLTPGGGQITPIVTPGGLLVTGARGGTFTKDIFAVVPQFQVKAGYHWSYRCSFFATYEFLYWNHVVRAADQITQAAVANPTLVERRFWANGFSLGVEIKY
jgi:hypothetical protein